MSKPTRFNTGDLVVLKSGGPTMTIYGENTSTSSNKQLLGYKCQWFAGKKLEHGNFPPDSLKAAPKDEKP